MSTVCEVCGDIGVKRLLICCRDCMCSATHQYCLEKVVFDASLADWVCYECLQKRGEVSHNQSLDAVLSERQPNHAHFDSTVHQPVTMTVDLSIHVGLWRNKKLHMPKYKSLKKRFKMKPNMRPIVNCNYRQRQIATSTDHAKSFQYCETIGAETTKGNNGRNQHVENETVTLNIEHPSPLTVHCLLNTNQSHISNGMEGLDHTNHDNPSNELLKRNVVDNIPQVYTLENKEMSSSPNDGFERAFSCASIKNIRGVRETNVHYVDISNSSQHGNTETLESSERFIGCQKSSFCHRGETIKMVTPSTSMVGSDDLQAPLSSDYVLSRTSYLSEAQKEKVMMFIQETKPEITVFVSVLGKTNVQLPGPYLGISKEYAFAYFPHESTKVTLQRPGMSKTWHLLFYKRNENGKNLLMGRWLDFVHDNSLQEGDICVLEPAKDETNERRFTFTVHLLRASTHATCGDGFQRAGPCPAKHVSLERVIHENLHESLESEDSDDPTTPPYIIPCRHDLSTSQKKIIEERVRAIRSEVPIYVTVMKNNNAGAAQRWMLELGVRFAAVYLPSAGQTVVLQHMGKTWNTQMVIHNGRRWFLNGGWTKFARDNGLRVGDICLFELKKNERKLTMDVHIISREQF